MTRPGNVAARQHDLRELAAVVERHARAVVAGDQQQVIADFRTDRVA